MCWDSRIATSDSTVSRKTLRPSAARSPLGSRKTGRSTLAYWDLGINGHIGFNEPGPFLQPHAHVATLSATSLAHAMIEHTSNRPTFGLTLGMADLLHARQIVLMVSGAAKRGPLKRLLEGPISTEFPASFLQLHRDLKLVCDQSAMGG